jgi:hypothetical protein
MGQVRVNHCELHATRTSQWVGFAEVVNESVMRNCHVGERVMSREMHADRVNHLVGNVFSMRESLTRNCKYGERVMWNETA